MPLPRFRRLAELPRTPTISTMNAVPHDRSRAATDRSQSQSADAGIAAESDRSALSQLARVASRREFFAGFGRRTFLAAGAVWGASNGLGWIARATAEESGGEPVRLKRDTTRDLFRVRMEMEVQGNVRLVRDPLRAAADPTLSQQRQLPLRAQSTLDFEEQFLRPKDADSDSEVIAARRAYYEASSRSEVNRNEALLSLRKSVGEVLARREFLPETVYSQTDYLTHDEIDLLRTPLSSVAIDHLIPTEPMVAGKPKPVDGAVVASLLNLSGVTSSDVEVELAEADADQARLLLRGKADATVGGVSTILRLVGKLTFDRRVGAVTWAAVAVHETREIGKAEPGFDLTAIVRMIRQPLARPAVLEETVPAIQWDQPAPRERLLTTLACRHAGTNALIDRRWRVIQDQPGLSILRMIDNERVIAQCNLRPLSRLPKGEQLTLAAFEKDCRRTLGDRLADLLQAEQKLSEAGLRVLRVTATGEVEGVPIQWIMMHFSDDDGRRVLATLTMDGQSVTQLDGSDVQWAETMTLVDPAPAGRRGPKTSDTADSSATTRRTAAEGAELGKQSDPSAKNLRAAAGKRLKSSRKAADGVMSASDLSFGPDAIIASGDRNSSR